MRPRAGTSVALFAASVYISARSSLPVACYRGCGRATSRGIADPMNRSRSVSETSVGLFAFLDVLMSTMGSLILVLMVVTPKIRQESVAKAAVAAQRAAETRRAVETKGEADKKPAPTFRLPLNRPARRSISTRNSKCSWRNFRRRCKSGGKVREAKLEELGIRTSRAPEEPSGTGCARKAIGSHSPREAPPGGIGLESLPRRDRGRKRTHEHRDATPHDPRSDRPRFDNIHVRRLRRRFWDDATSRS